MSRFEGPQGIVTNGLVLNLDAGDPDSYTRSQPPYVEVLVVAGGGSGGSSTLANGGGGGGGAGGVIYNSAYQLTSAAAVTVTVGAGGAGQTTNNSQGNNGSNSVFGSLTAVGGGGGGGAGANTTGRNGGSGGGAGYAGYYNNFNSGTGTTGQGFRGGYVLANNNGAAGGGAGGEGGNTFDSRPEPGYPAGNGGNGGPGVTYSISGTSTLYSTGGNGSLNGSNTIVSGSGTPGAYGGSGPTSTASSGIVIVRYPGLPAATGGTITYLNGYTIHTFTSSGTFTPYLWNDVSGNGNNGTLTNGPTFSSYINGGVILFDGVDDYTSLGNVFNYTSESFSFGYWVNFNSFNTNVPGQGPIIFYKGAFNTNGYYLQHGTTSFSFTTNQSGSSQTTTSVGVNTLGVWYYIVVTRNGSSVRGYVNGVDTTGTAGSHTNPASSTNDFTLARYASSIYFNGKLSNFTGYNRALTAAEILQNFNAQRNRFGV
jgi:hypothetical protein